MAANWVYSLWPHLWTPESNTGCYLWLGNLMGTKYRRPAVMFEGRKQAVTRLVCEGIATDTMVRHKCNNRYCVNPDHLLPGTHSDNMMDQPAHLRSHKARMAGLASGRARNK